MTTTSPASAATVTFIPIIPEYHNYVPLPACPDGSGDLWWDDASYIRYQVGPIDDYEPEHIQRTTVTDGFCNGIPQTYGAYLNETCAHHRAIHDADIPPF